MPALFPLLLFSIDRVEVAILRTILWEEEAVAQARQVKFTTQGQGRVVKAVMVSSLT